MTLGGVTSDQCDARSAVKDIKSTEMNSDRRAEAAAHNNTDWHDAVFSAHGIQFRRMPHALVSLEQVPPVFANLSVTARNHAEAIQRELLALVSRMDGTVGVKDSYRELDLGEFGFEVLFNASWIWREPANSTMPPGWEVVADADQLSCWEKSWKRSGVRTDAEMFPASLLGRPDVHFLGEKDDDNYVTGCVANLSSDCIGLSNVFAAYPSAIKYAEAANAAASIETSKPLVGYESGTDLEYAVSNGFQPVGDLRVLVRGNGAL